MNWYKLAFKINLLFDFYLIASLSKENLLYLLKNDPEFKLYVFKKLDYIRQQYVKEAMREINDEISHFTSSSFVFFYAPYELPELAQRFNSQGNQRAYGGVAWGSICSALYDLYLFPKTEEFLWNKHDDEFLTELLYSLIVKIDHFNDIAHNTGLLLRDITKNRNAEVFMDYKKEYDVRSLATYYSSDPELLRAIQNVGGGSTIDVNDAKQMMSLLFLGFDDILRENVTQVVQAVTKSKRPSYIYPLAEWIEEQPDGEANQIKILEDALIQAIHPKDSAYLVLFAKGIKSADRKKIQEAIINTGNLQTILSFARSGLSPDVRELEDVTIAAENSYYIYNFARDVLSADRVRLYNAILETGDTGQIKRYEDWLSWEGRK